MIARTLAAAVAGYVAWTILWLGGSAGIGAIWPAEYEAFGSGEPLTAFLPLLVTILLSLACSLVGGFAAASIVPHNRRPAVIVLAVLLVATGIGVQASVWSLMPVWFHLVFLVMLAPACVLGASLKHTAAGHP